MTMVGRFEANSFKYLGQDFSLIFQLFGFPADDKDTFGTQMNQIGTNFGGFLNDIYDYEKMMVLDDKDKLEEDLAAFEKEQEE